MAFDCLLCPKFLKCPTAQENEVKPLTFDPAEIELKIAASVREMNAVIEQLKPKLVVGLMSGGDDSIPACLIASKCQQFDGILHVNTGIGIEDTRTHVRSVCSEMGWKLWEYKASENTKADGTPDPMDYEAIVLKHGFPGAFGHRMMYSKLKERQLRRFKRDQGISGAGKKKQRVLFVSGVRKQESARRKKTVPTELISLTPSEIWAAPIREWDRKDCREAREVAGIPRNPVSFNIHKSGECLCGAFAKKGELAEIEFFYPETGRYLRDLERRAKEAGHNWGWEDQAPSKPKSQASTAPLNQHLCVKCNMADAMF